VATSWASLASSASAALGRRCSSSSSGAAGRGGGGGINSSSLSQQRRHTAAQPAALRSEAEAIAAEAAAENSSTAAAAANAAAKANAIEPASMTALEAAAAKAAEEATSSALLSRPFHEFDKDGNVRDRLLLNLYLLRGHAHQRAAAAAAAARGRLKQQAAAAAAGKEGSSSSSSSSSALVSGKKPKKATDSSAESMLFAPISHMLDGFVAAAARGAEEAAAKAAAAETQAAGAAEAFSSSSSVIDPASISSSPSSSSDQLALLELASDGARAAAAETAALWTRQLTNERRSLEAARARFSADLVQLAELGICPSAASPRSMMRRLYDPMVKAVREEQLRILSGARGTGRRHYGPFLLLLPAEDYAALALQGVLTETLKLSAKNFRGKGGGGGVVGGGGGGSGGESGVGVASSETSLDKKRRLRLRIGDEEAAELLARSRDDPLTALDAALESALPSSGDGTELTNVGIRGALGKAASREPGFAPFTGLARHLGRGVRDTVALGRLAAVVDRESTKQEKLARLWDAARKKVAARGKAGLTRADELELLDEFARVGPSTASYVEEELDFFGGDGTADALLPTKKKRKRAPKVGAKGTAASGNVYDRFSAVADGSTIAAGKVAPRLTPAKGTLHARVLARIEALAEEVVQEKREAHMRELRREHHRQLAEYQERLRRFEGGSGGGGSGGGSGGESFVETSSSSSSSSSGLPPPPTFPVLRRRAYFSQFDDHRIEAYRTRALQAIDNVSAWTKDDAVKVGGALCHLLVQSATVEVPIPDAAAFFSEEGSASASAGKELPAMPLPALSPLDLDLNEGEGGEEEEVVEEKEKGEKEVEVEEGSNGEIGGSNGGENDGFSSTTATKKKKNKKKKAAEAKFKPIVTKGAGEIIRRSNGRAFRVEPAFVRSHVRGGGKQVGGLIAHPQVMADAFTSGDVGVVEQLAEAGAAKAEKLRRWQEREEARRKGEEFYGSGSGNGNGGEQNKKKTSRSANAKEIMTAFLGPFAAERGALGLVSDVQLPMLVPPVPWRSHNEGGYLVSRSSAVRCKERGLQRRLLAAADDAPPVGLSRVYSGLNALGALPWKINAEILEAVERSIEREGGGFALIPPTRNEPMPQRSWRLARRPPTAYASATTAAEAFAGGRDRLPPYLIFTGAEFPQEFIARRRAVAATKKRNREAHSMRCDLGLKLAVAREFARGDDAIYYPHNLDFRGRAYPMHPHLNHLGNDVCRGLLTFAEPLELGEEGYGWLLVQVANAFGKGADKLPLDERRAFAEERLGALLASADDPWGDEPREWKKKAREGRNKKKLRFSQFGGDPADAGARWWLEADAPWQLLATAKELRDAHRAHPGQPWLFKSRLPVRVDGTCNGLQHYAALGRDEDGGRAVNLLPSGRPSDVYSDVAAVVRRRVMRDASELVASDPKRARAARLLLAAGVDRGLVKQTVMTSVYGVTYVGAREQVASRLRERGFFRGSDRVAAALAVDPLSPCSSGSSSSSSSSAARAPSHVFDDRTGNACFEAATYGALVTFDALAELFGGARAIMEWLGECAALVAGRDRAMAWTTPLGFPVAQPYRKRRQRVVQTVFQRLMLDDETPATELPISMPRAGRRGVSGGVEEEKENVRGGEWSVSLEGGEGQREGSSNATAAAAAEGDDDEIVSFEEALANKPSKKETMATSTAPATTKSRAMSPRELEIARRSSVVKRRQRTAFPPNFIHALDSTHMLSTAGRASEAGIAFAGVHDSFWTHAGTVKQLNELLREAFVELHSRPLLEDLLAQLRAAHPDITFPPLPARGKLELEKVRDSTYFFS